MKKAIALFLCVILSVLCLPGEAFAFPAAAADNCPQKVVDVCIAYDCNAVMNSYVYNYPEIVARSITRPDGYDEVAEYFGYAQITEKKDERPKKALISLLTALTEVAETKTVRLSVVGFANRSRVLVEDMLLTEDTDVEAVVSGPDKNGAGGIEAAAFAFVNELCAASDIGCNLQLGIRAGYEKLTQMSTVSGTDTNSRFLYVVTDGAATTWCDTADATTSAASVSTACGPAKAFFCSDAISYCLYSAYYNNEDLIKQKLTSVTCLADLIEKINYYKAETYPQVVLDEVDNAVVPAPAGYIYTYDKYVTTVADEDSFDFAQFLSSNQTKLATQPTKGTYCAKDIYDMTVADSDKYYSYATVTAKKAVASYPYSDVERATYYAATEVTSAAAGCKLNFVSYQFKDIATSKVSTSANPDIYQRQTFASGFFNWAAAQTNCSHLLYFNSDKAVTIKNAWNDGLDSQIAALKSAAVATNHSYVYDKTVAATCTATGYTEYVCADCGERVRFFQTPKVSHQFVEDVCTLCHRNRSELIVLSGTVTSFGDDTQTVTVELYKAGAEAADYSVAVTGLNTTYEIEGVASGTYTMKVGKTKHCTREYTVTVGSENVTQNVAIRLYGDISGDGKINITDATQAARQFSNMPNLISKATGDEQDYLKKVADVSGDGRINITDVTQIKRKFSNLPSLFNKLP